MVESLDHHITDEIMTLSELANYLKISEKSVLRMVHRGEIPVTKVASQWRFMRTMIDDWLISKMEMNNRTSLTRSIEDGQIDLSLSRLINVEHIIPDIIPGSKRNILAQLIAPLIKEGLISDDNALLSLLLEREKMVSTALSNKIAIPHIRDPRKFPLNDTFVVLGLCKEGIDYGSLDGTKTHAFFLVCTNSEVVHLKILARIALLTKNSDLISDLLSSKSKNDLLSTLLKIENNVTSDYKEI